MITTANVCLKNDLCCSWYNELYDDDDSDDDDDDILRCEPWKSFYAFNLRLLLL